MEGRQRRTPGAQAEGRGQIPCIRTDHIGRPAFATTLAGTVVWSVSYLPFGEVHVATGAPIDLRFPGQWFQAESGLYQNWMRDYDPTTGRYLEADPLGLVDGASVYGYVRQNPGRWVDPTGECPWCVAAGAGAAIGIALALLEEMFEHGANVECYDLRNIAASGLMGAAMSGLGPTGFLLGRGGVQSARYGYSRAPGLLNRWERVRFGWGRHPNGRDTLRLGYGSGAKRPHDDLFPPIGPRSGAMPRRDGGVAGAMGWLLSPEYDSCGCEE